jgi:mannan endo-1,6-alpha-mannosidase
MYEVACEGVGLCNLDQQSFKAYLSRWMAATTKWAPWTYDRIKPLLASSATAAATQCTGGSNGRMCGLKWANSSGAWDGTTGVGQQMAAMEIVLANMIQQADSPVTNSTGGTSVGNSGGGGTDIGRIDPLGSEVFAPLTTGDMAGAIICTVVVCAAILSTLIFLLSEEHNSNAENWNSFRSSLARGAAVGLLVKGVSRSKLNEKGKGIANDGSSTETGEKIASAAAFFQGQGRNPELARQPVPVMRYAPQPPGQASRNRGSAPISGNRRSLQKKNKRVSA